MFVLKVKNSKLQGASIYCDFCHELFILPPVFWGIAQPIRQICACSKMDSFFGLITGHVFVRVGLHCLSFVVLFSLFFLWIPNITLKDPSQPPPFSMPSKLLILHGEAKSYCLTVSCVPESMCHYL